MKNSTYRGNGNRDGRKCPKGLALPISAGFGYSVKLRRKRQRNDKEKKNVLTSTSLPAVLNSGCGGCRSEREIWDNLQQPWDEVCINAQIMLREDYLARLRKECLPLILGKDDTSGMDTIVHLCNLLQQQTVEIVANIEKHCMVNKVSTFLYLGVNYLLRIPSDLDFAKHLPQVCEALGIPTLERNPFLTKKPLPLPHKVKSNQQDVADCFLELLQQQKQTSTSIQNATRIILEEEAKHGVKPCVSSVATWKELDDLARQNHKRALRDQQIELEMLPRLAKIIVSENNFQYFRRNDRNGDGMLEYNEFIKAIERLRVLNFTSDDEKEWLIRKADEVGAGWISYKAFNRICGWAKEKCFRPKQRQPQRKGGKSKKKKEPQTFLSARESVIKEYDSLLADVEARQEKLQTELASVYQDIKNNHDQHDGVCPDRTQLDMERKADDIALTRSFAERTASEYPYFARPHIEYPMANKKRMESLIGDLNSWCKELVDAIDVLNKEEMQLRKAKLAKLEQISIDEEILKNQEEEIEMQRQEETEKLKARAELPIQMEKERAERQRKAQEYREKQRRQRKQEARARETTRRLAASCIQRLVRTALAKCKLKPRLDRKRRIENTLVNSLYFDRRDNRLSKRPHPVLVLSRHVGITQELQQVLPGQFWTTVDFTQQALNDELPVQLVIQNALNTSPGVIASFPELSDELVLLMQYSLLNVNPKPLVVYTAASSKSSKRKTKNLDGLALKGLLNEFTCPSIETLAQLERILKEPETMGVELVLDALKLLMGIDFSSWLVTTAEPRLFLARLCLIDEAKVELDVLEHVLELVNDDCWPAPCFRVSPVLSMLCDFIRFKCGLPIKSRFNEVVDLDLSDCKSKECAVDSIVQVAVCELRVYQSKSKYEAAKVSIFRYGAQHVLVRTMIPERPITYRIWNVAQIASRLSSLENVGTKPHEILGQLIVRSRKRFFEVVEGNQDLESLAYYQQADDAEFLETEDFVQTLVATAINEGLRQVQSENETVVREVVEDVINLSVFRSEQKKKKLVPDPNRDLIDTGAALHCGHDGSIVWIYIAGNGKRVQVRLFRTQAPFEEYRGHLQLKNSTKADKMLVRILERMQLDPDNNSLSFGTDEF